MPPHTTSSSQRAGRRCVRLNPKLEKQLGAYAASVSAAVVALAGAPPASAKIVYTPVDVSIGSSYALDLNGDGIADFTIFRCFCAGSHTSFLKLAFDAKGNAVRPPSKDAIGAAALPVGAMIGNQQSFQTATYYGGVSMAFGFAYGSLSDQGGPWINATNKYLGLKFLIDGQVHYGWARLTVGNYKFNDRTVTLTGYAYETVPGRMLHAGEKPKENNETESQEIDSAPESTLGILALGADRRNSAAK